MALLAVRAFWFYLRQLKDTPAYRDTSIGRCGPQPVAHHSVLLRGSPLSQSSPSGCIVSAHAYSDLISCWMHFFSIFIPFFPPKHSFNHITDMDTMVSRKRVYQNLFAFIKGFDNESFIKCHYIPFVIQ